MSWPKNNTKRTSRWFELRSAEVFSFVTKELLQLQVSYAKA